MSWGEYSGDLVPGTLARLEGSFGVIDAYEQPDLMGHLTRFDRGDEPLFVVANVVRAPRQTHEWRQPADTIRAVLVLTARGQLGWVDDIKLETR